MGNAKDRVEGINGCIMHWNFLELQQCFWNCLLGVATVFLELRQCFHCSSEGGLPSCTFCIGASYNSVGSTEQDSEVHPLLLVHLVIVWGLLKKSPKCTHNLVTVQLLRLWGGWVYEAYLDESFQGLQLLLVSILILFS